MNQQDEGKLVLYIFISLSLYLYITDKNFLVSSIKIVNVLLVHIFRI